MDEYGYIRVCKCLIDENSSTVDINNAIKTTKLCLTCSSSNINHINYNVALKEVLYWDSARRDILEIVSSDMTPVLQKYKEIPKTHIGQCMFKCFQNTCVRILPGENIRHKKYILYNKFLDLNNPLSTLIMVVPEI
jgi:tetrahydrodipicolinate N-succinyltransferase